MGSRPSLVLVMGNCGAAWCSCRPLPHLQLIALCGPGELCLRQLPALGRSKAARPTQDSATFTSQWHSEPKAMISKEQRHGQPFWHCWCVGTWPGLCRQHR